MLQILTPLALIIAAVLIRTDRRIVQELRGAQATTVEGAISLNTSGIRGIRVKRLTNLGCLHMVSDDRYYLDEQGWSNWRSLRRGRIIAAVFAGVIITALVIILRQS